MANGDFLYALPLPISSHILPSSRKKRKRDLVLDDEAFSQDDLITENTEYSAVVTPDERQQRRLAGQDVSRPPPDFPFPHAPQPKPRERDDEQSNTATFSNGKAHSLRLQHLATMTALLHKCLAARDYQRASRALALILRTEIGGRTIDLRHTSLWAIGAEVLLRTPDHAQPGLISREGFERAKLFYDKMALQHPWHRSWPNVVNAQDFRLAMFSLWIYVVCQQSKHLQVDEHKDTLLVQEMMAKELEVKRWELCEAERIAREMDTLLGTVPYIDDLELIRLRGMVALWCADLLEAVDALEIELEKDLPMIDKDLEQTWLNETTAQGDDPTGQVNDKVLRARNLANTMFARLPDGNEEDASLLDELNVDTAEFN
ncbi:hypothetical protein LTR64_001692 [Lithohypha guttulata]|uniref:uncharacterized protein n=1 Tax=Lithohypha guttulata TaxID=1690604 RepID=UPI002DDF1DD1|nr:hypothetical protein LTR51_003886 [Lithohypha guttulata]